MLVVTTCPQWAQVNPSRWGPSGDGGIVSRIVILPDVVGGVVEGRRDSAEVAVFEPVAVAFEGDHFSVVDQPVDHGGDDDVVCEDLAPPAERLVGGDDR